MIRLFAILTAVLLVSACEAPKPRGALIPKTAMVTAPGPEVPSEYAAFSGVWDGMWADCLPGKLIVTDVDATGAMKGVYSFGDCEKWKVKQGSTPVTGQIEGNQLMLEKLPNGAAVSYRLEADGGLIGSYAQAGETTLGAFRKQ